jgi:hypothetical protein
MYSVRSPLCLRKRIRPGHILLALLRMNDEFVVGILEASQANFAGHFSSVLAKMDSAYDRPQFGRYVEL